MAVLASWVWVLISCIFAAVAEGSDISNLYPSLWEESPKELSDYSLEDGKYIINPWVFTDRMGLCRILLNQTAQYFARYGPENEQNLLWGLTLQLDWKYRTGRLADPTGMTNCGYDPEEPLCISVDSWWADVNYFLSVLPFLAAVESGILGISADKIKILPPPLDALKFCYNISDCQEFFGETMDDWKAFFKYMQSPSSDFDGLLKHLWTAQTSSIEYAVSAFRDRHTYYSDQEEIFEKNWAVAANYLAAVYFPATLNRTASFHKYLPPRVLGATDRAPVIPDFTSLQNKLLMSLTILGDIDRLTESLSLSDWKILMSSKLARQQFLKAFEEFLGIST